MDVAGKRGRTATGGTDVSAMSSDAGASDAVAPTPTAVIERFGAPTGINAIVRFYDSASYEILRLGDMIEVRYNCICGFVLSQHVQYASCALL